ncbi:MAG: UbiD family decarboxylase [Rhodospirillales bacterium]|nr:UbiD family decarboxylase [Rhodospirillales bacterium]
MLDEGHVTTHEDPVALCDISSIVEETPNTHLFRKAVPEQYEMVCTIGATRERLAMAFEVEEDQMIEEYRRRMANPQPVVEVSSAKAPSIRCRSLARMWI